MPGLHGTSLKDYTRALTTQLQLRHVSGDVIGEIVAEVEPHVRETGEDPVEVFGQPGSYSAQFTGGRTPGPRGRWAAVTPLAATVGAVVGSWMSLGGVFSLTGVVRITPNMILACAAMALMFSLVVRSVDLAMTDRETRTVTTGRPVQSSRAAQWLRFLALWATILVVMEIHARAPEEPVLLRLPGLPLLLAGLALVAASVWVQFRRSDRIVDPRGPRRGSL